MPGPDIFLSYNREDQAVAKRFAEGFEAAGMSVWWDVTLRSGEAYDAVTEEALKTAKAVVVLWSPRSVVSRWVRAEATLADRNRTLVPSRIEPCELPIMFELTQTADLSHWRGEGDDPAWQAFLDDVRRMVGAVAEPAPPLPFASQPSRGRKPSIAVLPFVNRSGQEEDDVFAVGMVEDLTAALSLSKRMKVIAASATAAYRTGARDLRQIGLDLGVRYLLEGNVRRVSDNLRVTAQLVQAEDGDILWTEKFDRPLAELAALQEELVTEVAACLGVQVQRAEMEQALRKPDDITAWEAVLRAEAHMGSDVPTQLEAAIAELHNAIAIEPDYDLANASLAMLLGFKFRLGGSQDEQLRREVLSRIARSQATASKDPIAMARVAMAFNFLGQFQDALPLVSRAVSLNPNLDVPRQALGVTLHHVGRWDEAIDQLKEVEKLAPNGPWTGASLFFRAMAYLCLGRPEQGLVAIERALLWGQSSVWEVVKALCQAEAGAEADARATLRRFRATSPAQTRAMLETFVRDTICSGTTPERTDEHLSVFNRLWEATGVGS